MNGLKAILIDKLLVLTQGKVSQGVKDFMGTDVVSKGTKFTQAVLNKIVRWINTFFPSEVFIIHIVSMNILDHIPIKFSG